MDDELASDDALVDEALGGNPRARELRLMREALEERRARLLSELERSRHTDAPAAARMQSAVSVLNTQIDALHREESISEFVETTVRVNIARGPSTVDEEEE